jgi:class 3 adenylate cyclase
MAALPQIAADLLQCQFSAALRQYATLARMGIHVIRCTNRVQVGFRAMVQEQPVRAAVQFQTRIKELTISEMDGSRLAFRVGVNIGDVIVEAHDIFGDGVNIAARLESIAEPGGICISSAAYDQVRGKVGVEFVDLGEQNLKNIDRPVRAYAVVRDGPSPATQTQSARQGPLPLSPPRLSIVVLPFANLIGDPEHDDCCWQQQSRTVPPGQPHRVLPC